MKQVKTSRNKEGNLTGKRKLPQINFKINTGNDNTGPESYCMFVTVICQT